jgi:long-chain acyl-CoA synthetase
MRTLQTLVHELPVRGAKAAVVALRRDGAQRWSYAELGSLAQRLARALIARGLHRGEPVVLFAGNRPEWIAACLGAIRAGAMATPVDVQLGRRSLEHVLRDSGARWAFTTRADAKRLADFALSPLFLDEELPQDVAAPLPDLAPEDFALLFYTSGTTGHPKGVPLTHANVVFEVAAFVKARLLTENDHVLLPLPLHHVYPLVGGVLSPLAYGVQIVMPRALTGPDVLRALREGAVTTIIGVPRLYRALEAGIHARIESRGQTITKLFDTIVRLHLPLLHSLHAQLGPTVRLLASGGSALDPGLASKLTGMGWRITVGYGLTETAPLLTLLPPGDKKLDTVGKPIPGVELRIVNGEVRARRRTRTQPRASELPAAQRLRSDARPVAADAARQNPARGVGRMLRPRRPPQSGAARRVVGGRPRAARTSRRENGLGLARPSLS